MSKEERYEARIARKDREQNRKQSRQLKGRTLDSVWVGGAF